jgi:hypothetical protein
VPLRLPRAVRDRPERLRASRYAPWLSSTESAALTAMIAHRKIPHYEKATFHAASSRSHAALWKDGNLTLARPDIEQELLNQRETSPRLRS